MNCPVCNVELKMSERQGVEIDYCPQCRGVWLDRGELDKIIERSAGEQRQKSDDPYRQQEHYSDRHDDYSHGGKKKKRDSFLEDLFDF